MSKALVSPKTRLGHVHFTVLDLEDQITFYQEIVGLKLHWQKDGSAGLGVGNKDLVRLTEDKTARRYPHATGLYHQAFLLPSRKELARVIARLFKKEYPNSPTDHTISQTTYLEDPEGNTIELLADTPEEGTWVSGKDMPIVKDKFGNTRSGVEPLDVEKLFKELNEKDDIYMPLPKETITGHVHLYVNNLDTAMHFYSDIVGFKKQNVMPSFRMADTTLENYNVHIVAFNTWKGLQAQKAPGSAIGMKYFTITFENKKELDDVLSRIHEAGIKTTETPEGILVNDPVENGVVLTTK